MQHFEEKQKFDQWWLYALIILSEIVIFYSLYHKTSGFSEIDEPGMVLTGIFSMLLLSMIFLLRLHTKISSAGIVASFHPIPFFTRKFFWNEIDKNYVRKYSAISEYGGWGIRGLFPAKAYNVSGNYGIQIVTKNGHKFLIGTHKPEEVKNVLNKLHNTSSQ